MTSRDIFGIIVRTAGLAVVFFAVRALSFALAFRPIGVGALLGAVYLVLGLALIFKGGCVARLAYRDDKNSN